MIPELVDGVLPVGIHRATFDELTEVFGWTTQRMRLIEGFKQGVEDLRIGGCEDVWLDGSFATNKEVPGDFDACWDPTPVDLSAVDPVLLDMSDGRKAQKQKYGGEFMPNVIEGGSGMFFVEFFQQDRNGNPKGILHFRIEDQ